MRIAVINLQSGIGITKGYREYFTSGWRYLLPHSTKYVRETGQLLKDEGVDIALMTEVEEHGLRSGFRKQTEILREASNLPFSEFFATRSMEPLAAEGNAILCRYPVLETRSHLLTPGAIPRVMGEAMLSIEDQKVHVLVAHLGIRNVYRARQIERIRHIIQDRDEPVILGGDFNERNHESFEILRSAGFSHIATLPTYPSWKPVHALSVLFLSKHFSEPRVYIPSAKRFSDHLPLVVEATLA
ncbi:MAG TPA: endonuclease/exonuclease/phosphatase family protein [Candidatus Paceibacterota bacterium]|nr:endonuclease/exonuclease/phosphatase family protein [Candidatus Paceibacterota bacterium]